MWSQRDGECVWVGSQRWYCRGQQPWKENCCNGSVPWNWTVEMMMSVCNQSLNLLQPTEVQWPRIVCVKLGLNRTLKALKWELMSYLTPGSRGPIWSPGAETETLCAPPGSLAPVRRAGGTAGGRRTGRAHRGLTNQPWQPNRTNRATKRAEMNFSALKVTGGSGGRADEVKLQLLDLLGSASSRSLSGCCSWTLRPPGSRSDAPLAEATRCSELKRESLLTRDTDSSASRRTDEEPQIHARARSYQKRAPRREPARNYKMCPLV